MNQTYWQEERHVIKDGLSQPLSWLLVVALCAWWWLQGSGTLEQGIVLATLLGLLTVIDIRSHILPDLLILPLGIIGLIYHPQHWPAVLLGLAVFGSITAFYIWRYKRWGIGGGDTKLLAVLGAWVGISGLLPLILLASVSALLYILISRRARHLPLPFGPFLLAGGWLSLLYQDIFWRILLP